MDPQRADVVRAIHALNNEGDWEECRGKIHRNFNTKHSNASITILPRVLEKIPVMLFAGDQDFICNYMGIESLIQNMEWNGGTGLGVCCLAILRFVSYIGLTSIFRFQTVQTQSWSVAGQPAGTWVASRNLTYVKVIIPQSAIEEHQ